MAKKCLYLPIISDSTVELYADYGNFGEIWKELSKKDKSKTQRIFQLIVEGRRNREYFDYYDKYDVFAIKYKGGDNNLRIYCKEFAASGDIPRRVVLVKAFKKKEQSIDSPRMKAMLKPIGQSEYEFIKLLK